MLTGPYAKKGRNNPRESPKKSHKSTTLLEAPELRGETVKS